jgi:vacuolar-type H+-ATPase subunit H
VKHEGRREEIDADALLNTEIPIVRRGYALDTVDALLDRAAATIDRLRALDEPELERRRRSQAELLHRTLMLAQASADQRVAEAESTAGSAIADAQARASRLVSEAEVAARELVDAEATRARSALNEVLARRERVRRDVDELERFASEVRARLRDVFMSEAAALERLLDGMTADRPAPCEIDLSDTMLVDELTEYPAPPTGDPTRAWTDDGDERRAVMAVLVGDEPPRRA